MPNDKLLVFPRCIGIKAALLLFIIKGSLPQKVMSVPYINWIKNTKNTL